MGIKGRERTSPGTRMIRKTTFVEKVNQEDPRGQVTNVFESVSGRDDPSQGGTVRRVHGELKRDYCPRRRETVRCLNSGVES